LEYIVGDVVLQINLLLSSLIAGRLWKSLKGWTEAGGLMRKRLSKDFHRWRRVGGAELRGGALSCEGDESFQGIVELENNVPY